MYISLSSKNESNNSNFSNYFQDTLVIPPNSQVCLVNASLVVSESAGFLTIGTNQFIDVMVDAWNIVHIPLVAGTYTINDWVNLQNASTIMTQSNPVYYFEFVTVEEKVNFKFYRHQGPLQGNYILPYNARFAYNDYFNGGPYNFDNRFAKTQSDDLPQTFPPNSIGADNNIEALGSIASARYQICTHYDSYPPPIRNWDYAENGKSFDFNRYMGEFVFQCGSISNVTSFILCRGRYNAATSEYQISPTEYLCNVSLSTANKIKMDRKDIDGNNQTVITDEKVHPGSIFIIKSDPASAGGGVGEFEFGQKLERLEQPDGLQLWCPMDYTGTGTERSYNSSQGWAGSFVVDNAVIDIIQSDEFNTSDAQALTYYNKVNLGIGKVGWRAGYKNQFIQDEFVGTDGEGLTRDMSSQMPDSGSVFFRRLDEQRYRFFENNGVSLFPNQNLDTVLPSMIMFTFKITADATTSHIFLGGSNEVLRIDPTSVANNIQYYDSAGTLYQTAFAGHQIVANNWYTFGIATFGNLVVLGDPVIRVLLMESNGNFHFTDTATITTKPKNLRLINTLGGLFESTGNPVHYCNASICDFRYYQHNEYSDITGTTYWDAIFQDIGNYSVNTANAAAAKPKRWFGVLENVDMWQPQAQNDYNAAFAADGTKPMYTMLVDRDAGANAQGGEWFDLANLGATSQNLMIDADDAITVVNPASDSALGTEGVGLVNGNGTDADTVLNLFEAGFVDEVSKILTNADPTNIGIIAEFAGGVITPSDNEQVHNVNIKNLPQQSYDGNRHQISKTIYQLPAIMDERQINQNIHKCYSVPQKVYIDLHNPGELILNSLEVEITDEDGREDERLEGTTNISIEIKSN